MAGYNPMQSMPPGVSAEVLGMNGAIEAYEQDVVAYDESLL